MTTAKHGDTVKIHYTGKLEDGTLFDSSASREPLEFTIGKSKIIAGFEQAIIGMKPGDSKTVNIPVEQAYGAHRPDMVVSVDRKELPPDLKPVLGQQLQVSQDENNVIVVCVTAVTDTHVTLDANHPLAGKNLVFDIKLVGIVPGCSCCH
ncbi:MAG: peptidylprolyl isomerase [Candidatus Omnitrophota bacterium]